MWLYFYTMPRKNALSKGGGTWNFRDVPRALMRRTKMAAVIQGKSIKGLLIDLLEDHIQKLEKKGVLPKGR